ncbi:L-lactate dehydrogenase [Clostridium saccharobutylicum]|uniref:L-lactate dehydrogenase n=1 Tax=Clostridium saccharobutylicum DSM 13864 TaxID=1345695 RepID=U5MWZ2_CLOSA|nr:L-lactate dehydrogenase [Clostridium saccharobutylicum]AGX45319.1 L-lactate dehydrogenase 3 [Clostridium saccharobutylicum DSM 13864]AQR92594.1 L-lactate dehydrogenase 2 [Clostridium saccharobutylicum]AQS02496.1 L-lactate dehydrogenase 2 [Clostridium saccharobutylicum]AQS12098.1 L-lactate dehydrogenase 2 [Clostridium saccharobutylicum]AQS16479.1 L-lactate dehydrogenase 2 [Clostridium saccharobutylicum]
MSLKKSKVAIVGTGLVGSSTAFSLITQGVCDEILMIDINKEKALGEVMDLNHCIEYLNRNTKVVVGSYDQCSDVDIVVITAGAPPKPGQSRLDTLELSAKIVESIVNPIMKSGFNGYFVVISNPVDIIAYHVYKISGLPKSHVIGTGTAIDSARLKNFIGDLLNVDPRSVQGYSMGEHGDSQMVPWSHVTVGGKSFFEILKDNQKRVGNVDLDKLVLDTARAGWEVYNRKGTTYYGIAAATVGIIKAIMYNENKIIPVSTLLEGEYGENDIFCGVPVVLNADGVKEVVEIHMADDELDKFKKSVQLIREYTEKIK